MKSTFIQEESTLIQFHVFQLFLLSDFWAPKRAFSITTGRCCVPYLKFVPFQFLSDFHGLEEIIFSPSITAEIGFCSV